MSDTARDDLRPLGHFTGRLPGTRGGTSTHPGTAARWILRGVRLPDGSVCRLKALKVGSRWMSSERWWDEFLAAATAASLPADSSPAPRTPAARTRASAAAAKTLDRAGVK